MLSSDKSASGSFLTDSEYVLTMLVNRMRLSSEWVDTVRPRPVFLLGAGCSKQYGLPTFKELLIHLWEDQLHVSPGDATAEELRDGLEKYWNMLGPDSRQAVLRHYLQQAQGAHCPGYVRLARLARQGYVAAFVNMNFDSLLEEALDATGVDYQVSTTFQDSSNRLMVYKPHGSIGRVHLLPGSNSWKDGFEKSIQTVREAIDHLMEEYGHLFDTQELVRLQENFVQPSSANQRSAPNDLILDIAKGDLFADSQEQWCAQRLLSGSDVVAIGYSGVDAKIGAALLGFRWSQDPRNHKLFIVNPVAPDPRLALPQEERGSRGLSIVGEEGYFEGFMEELEKALEVPPGRQDRRPDHRRQGGTENWEVGTRAERAAFQECLQFSRILWGGLGVQGRISVNWEEHGREVYGRCRELAPAAGICLTSPEKYVLQCAALLHDLGYFAAHGEERGADNPGWRRLKDHGELTAVIVKERLEHDPDQRRKIVPQSYGAGSTEAVVDTILSLCRHHAGAYRGSEVPEVERAGFEVEIAGCRVLLRRELLLALFAAAEELVVEQPTLPGNDVPLEAASVLVEDAILDLFLRWKPRELKVEIRNRRVLYTRVGTSKRMSRGLLAIARLFVLRLDELSRTAGGWGLEFVSSSGEDDEIPLLEDGERFKSLLIDALEESLSHSLAQVEPGSILEVPTVLDLLAIHTLRTDSGESRLPLTSDTVRHAFTKVKGRAPSSNLLQHYFTARTNAEPTALEKFFGDSFERILYGAWRIFARRWRNKTSIVPTAVRCLDMGSSRFRAETVDGFRYVLEKMIHWDGDRAFAHDECTLCTSRLLYILAQGRRLFTDADLKTISGHSHSLNESIAGLLRYFLSREPEALSWWGLGTRSPGQMIVDVQYLAWSARGVSFCLAVDRELRKTGTHWLDECGIPLSSVERLLQQRWRQLFGIRDEDLVGDREELTHELALGNIGLACLDLDALDPEIRALALDGLDLSHAFWPNLRKAWTKLERRSSLVSSLHLIPATLALDGAFPDLTPETTPMLVELYLRCAASPAWVTTGSDVGEWGFDSKATQPILDSLIAFWRYAFRPENRSRFEAAFEEIRPGSV